MKKRYVLAVVIILAMGMTACSFESREGAANGGTVDSSETIRAENTETKSEDTKTVDTEPIHEELAETDAAGSDEKEASDAVEISQGDPIVVIVDRYEDNIIVGRDIDDEAILYYFSTEDAEVIEGDSPITAGDIVEITYQGVQGDEEHPGTAVKVVAEAMMYSDLRSLEGSEQETSLAAYRQIVEESDAGMVFSLINLDGDEIPELAAGDRGDGRYSVYTIKDGTVFCLVDSMTTEELAYFERGGIIAVFSSWNGGGDEGGYGRQYYQIFADKTLADGDIPLLSYSYNAVYGEDGIYTGNGVTDYFYMGQESNESVYNEVLGTMGITEDGGRLCLENAVFAEEMLNILK